MANAYRMVAEVRHRELKGRLALAMFIAVTTWIIAPSTWPALWLGGVFLGQACDWLAFRPLRREGEGPAQDRAVVLGCLSCLINTTLYSSISIYLWSTGETGMVFGTVLVAGALLHVTLHLYHARPILICSATPHALYFLGLPIGHAVLFGSPQDYLIAVGCLLYMTHLVAAVRQSSTTTTALKQANAIAMEEGRRAEVASAAKSDFLAVVSHEIRTPMNAVMAAAALLERSRLDERQREQVEMLKDAGDVLVGLLNDVLDFSKIEAGKMQIEPISTDLMDKLEGLQRLWEPRADAKGVRIVLKASSDVPECILVDALRLQQILFNLLSNAVKFTDAGMVTISAGWCDTQDLLIIRVSDTGCGIPEDRLPFIFDQFEQVDAGTTRRFGGTGLGLAIARRLAELMGGSLIATSVVGEGSEFELRLPVEIVEKATTEAPAPLEADLSQLSILVVDDHPVNRRIVSMLLEPYGCVLDFAEDGAQAVELCTERTFDIILMDMQMPVMDGVTATREIRTRGANRTTPVIALTANAMEAHRQVWLSVGVETFLTKPIDPRALLEGLQRTNSALGRAA